MLRLSSNEPPSCWLRLARSRAALILDSAHGATGSGNPLFNSTNMPTQVWHEWMRDAIYRHWYGGTAPAVPIPTFGSLGSLVQSTTGSGAGVDRAALCGRSQSRPTPCCPCAFTNLVAEERSALRAPRERGAPGTLPMVLMIRDNPTGAPMNLGAGRAGRDARVVAILSHHPTL